MPHDAQPDQYRFAQFRKGDTGPNMNSRLNKPFSSRTAPAALGIALSAFALLLHPLPLRAEGYVAETGRTQQSPAANASAISGLAAEAATTGSASAAPRQPLVEISGETMANPRVQQAILDSGIDRIAVQTEGWNYSLRSFAEIQVAAITGKPVYKGQDPVFTVLSMIYNNQQWARVPMLPVEDPRLAEAFGLDRTTRHRVSAAWVMRTPQARQLVLMSMQGPEALKQLTGGDADLEKAVKRFQYHIFSFLNLPGEFKLAALPSGEWIAPAQLERPDGVADENLKAAIGRVDRTAEPFAGMMAVHEALRTTFARSEAAGLREATRQLIAAMDTDPNGMPSNKRTLDYYYTALHPFHRASQIFMIAFFAFLVFLWTARKNKPGSGTPGSGDDIAEPLAENDAKTTNAQPQTARSGLSPAAVLGGLPAMAMAAASGPQPVGAGAGSASVIAAPGAAGVPKMRLPDSKDNRPNAGASNPGDGATGSDLIFDNEGSEIVLSEIAQAKRGNRTVWGVSFALLVLAGIVLVAALAVRFALSGRMPVSNMYESITFAMGAFAIVAIVFEGIYRQGYVGASAAFFGWGLMTLANSMPLHSRKVEPLVAVLNSVWLNYHVTSLLISYALFLMGFICAVMYLLRESIGKTWNALPRKEMFEYLTYRSIQVGWPLLTLGILLGAVWANTAWGSAWSWDPKETWALITWLTYSVYLHLRMNVGWTGRAGIVASIVGFLMVLVTYFGVSYLPGLAGGMHSYAEPIQR